MFGLESGIETKAFSTDSSLRPFSVIEVHYIIQFFHSTNLTNQGRVQASSLDDIYMRSSMTSDSSLYDSEPPRKYYDGTDPVRYLCRVSTQTPSLNKVSMK